ncbi:MAG: ATP-binding cassette domain-containing protein [Acidimicrobiia bacterium]|nr:ATP-binding cassette domain-containing protein [Acidimicrobiia bacterium]MYL09164.1 ATP-binding cassette domain-containing protein [Acidimicrobiia bacterium]
MTAPSESAPGDAPAVRCRSLGVSFGTVQALREVSLDLAPGRIHALVGQNGAGKTTLAKVLGGLQAPQTGDIYIDGRRIPPGDVRAAQFAGLAMVHQHFSLPPSFTVAEALELAAARKGGRPIFRRAKLHRQWQNEVAELGGPTMLSTRIRDLPVETRQSLEIVRALAGDARILLLDEPTALLTPAAIDQLFERLLRLRDEGVTILIVLHKLREVTAIAETVSVLRDGELVLGPSEMTEVSEGQLSDAIVGPESAEDRTIGKAPAAEPTQETLLELVGVSSRETAFELGLNEINFRVESREIVGIAGVEGNGQRSLVSAIAGLTPIAEGSLRLGGIDATRAGPARRRLRGLRLVPFDRNSEGVSRTAPLWLNQSALRLVGRNRQRFPLISLRQYKRQAAEAMDVWRVRYDAVGQPAESLSGGNVQRLILSRELAPGVEVLVAAQPTRGLDFSATNFVRRSLRELRDGGAGVLLISSDLDELFELSDRLLVIYGGRIVASFEAPYDRAAVGDAMTGALR